MIFIKTVEVLYLITCFCFLFIGFSGNGYYCTDIDECDVNNGGCSINPKVTCINTLVNISKLIFQFNKKMF